MELNTTYFVYFSVGVLLFVWRVITKRKFIPSKIRLIQLLDKAERMAYKYSGGYSAEFLSAEEFHSELKTAIEEYKNGDATKLDLIYIWFAPTCAWDDFVGKEGENLGNEIFYLVSKLKKK